MSVKSRELSGRYLSENILKEAKSIATKVLNHRKRAPQLAIIAASNKVSDSYLKAKRRACQFAGVNTAIHFLSHGPRQKLIGLLSDIVSDPLNDAIIIETPYPAGLSLSDISSIIPAHKDAEGISTANYGQFYLSKSWSEAKSIIGPCTASSIIQLLLEARIKLAGLKAVVIGRSATVGRPTAHLLSTLDMTVTLAHSQSKSLPKICQDANVIVAAAGIANLVKPSWVKTGSIILDAGIHVQGKKIIGDVSVTAYSRASFYTPVPGGVGPVTTAISVLHTARLALQHCEK